MTFYFFDAADRVLFARDDAEQAEHNHQEMSFYALFPYDPGKVIQAGMRVGYTDALGVFQAFEVRTPKSYEPDHYQEITAEHIAIAELTDEMYTAGDIMNKTPAQALTAVLTGTLWSVGNVTATNNSSAQFSYGYVWDDVRSIEQNWNVYITPRITVDATGITGRYLDIAPAQPTWRGLRFALEKNLDDASVTWDTSRLKTALYGYGKSAGDEHEVTTFANVTWTQTADHPAKPAGQTYLEDPEATAAYGRNGRPRFGYYQNGDVDDPQKLLELTWETLKTVNAPDVTIDGQVRDLTKFGEVDVPIRLHDSAQIEITPTDTLLVREVIQYTEDLIQPERSRVTIGKYIPNIVYITKEIAGGKGGGGGSGGDTDAEYKLKEYETDIGWNDYQISLKAWQRDLDKTDENLLLAYAAIGISSSQIQAIVTGSGVQLDPETGNIVTDSNGLPVFAAGSSQMWGNVQLNANRIALVVTQAGGNDVVNTASIVAAVNAAGSSVTINADKITLNGQTLVSEINGIEANFTKLTTGQTTATMLRATRVQAGSLAMNDGGIYTPKTATMDSTTSFQILSTDAVSLGHSHWINASVSAAGVVSLELGRTQSANGTANFNLADTAFYQNAVSAAQNTGYRNAANAIVWPTQAYQESCYITYPNTSGTTSQKAYFLTEGSWASGQKLVSMRQNNTTGTIVAQRRVSLPASGTWNVESRTGTQYGIPISASFRVAGKTYTYTGEI